MALVLAAIFSKSNESIDDFYERHFNNILKASEKQNSLALYSLGVYFDTGEFVEEDKEKAFFLFKASAELGMPQAQHIYGIMQYYGTGGAEQDVVLGLSMVERASKEGVQEAAEFLNYLNKE